MFPFLLFCSLLDNLHSTHGNHFILFYFIYLFIFYFYLFIFTFGWAGSWLLCGLFSSFRGRGLFSSCGAWAPNCDSSSCGAQAPGCSGLRSCNLWAQQRESLGSTAEEQRLQGVQASGAATCGRSRGSPWALPQRRNSCVHPLSCSAAVNTILIQFLILKYILNIFLCHHVFFSSSSF